MRKITRTKTIIIAVIFSIILYLSGVFTGLNANKILEIKVQGDVQQLKNALDSSALDIKNLQLQQLFIDNFEEPNQCRFMDIYLNHLYLQLKDYWSVLPERLEEYEKTHDLTEEYITLKREYMRLSLRIWLIARKNYNRCDDNFVPILYFYSKECEVCIDQGVELDKLNENMNKEKRTLLVFPVDGEFEDDTIFLLKDYYNITDYPALVLNDIVVQGNLETEGALSKRLRR